MEYEVYTKKEIAAKLGISLSLLARYIRQGLPHFKVGREYRFEFPVVVAWLKATYELRQKADKKIA